jgi:N-methylhydantoinase A
MAASIAHLTNRARHWMVEEQHYEGTPVFHATGEMRYRGQSFEIEVPIDPAALTSGDVTPITEAFHAEHRRLYGHADLEAPIQIIAINLVVTGHSAKPTLAKGTLNPRDVVAEKTMHVHIDGVWRDVGLFARTDLTPGARFASPCVIAQDDTTTIVPAGVAGTVDAHGNLILTLSEVNHAD